MPVTPLKKKKNWKPSFARLFFFPLVFSFICCLLYDKGWRRGWAHLKSVYTYHPSWGFRGGSRGKCFKQSEQQWRLCSEQERNISYRVMSSLSSIWVLYWIRTPGMWSSHEQRSSSRRSSNKRPSSALWGGFLFFTLLLWVHFVFTLGSVIWADRDLGLVDGLASMGSVTVHSGHLLGSKLEVFAANQQCTW